MRTAWNTPGKSMAATWLVVVISRISVRPWPRSKVTWCGACSTGKRAASSRSSVGWLPFTVSTYSPPRSSSASMLPRCTGSAAAVMTVPVRSPLPSSVQCPATVASSGTTSGELVGVRGDGALTDDNPLAVPERGEQPDLPAAGVQLGPGAFERLAVQRERGEGRDLPGLDPPGAELADELGDLPLALEQAAGYIESNDTDPQSLPG